MTATERAMTDTLKADIAAITSKSSLLVWGTRWAIEIHKLPPEMVGELRVAYEERMEKLNGGTK